MSDQFSEADDAPLPGIGHNIPLPGLISDVENFSQAVTDWLHEEFGEVPKTVMALLEEARALPAEITDDASKGQYTSLIKRIRDEAKRIEAFHEKEKTPYLRGGQAVDQFFFGCHDRLARRDRKAKPGAADVLNARLTDYDTKVLAAEQARRKAIADEADRVARVAAAEAERVRLAAEEAQRAAERARKPEIVEQKQQAAGVVAQQAHVSAADAERFEAVAQEAHINTLAKPADIMRTRGDDGTLSTMGTEPYAVIEDEAKLDRDKLWPFIPLAAKEQALRTWARTTGFQKDSMLGASIGRRPKSVVR